MMLSLLIQTQDLVPVLIAITVSYTAYEIGHTIREYVLAKYNNKRQR